MPLEGVLKQFNGIRDSDRACVRRTLAPDTRFGDVLPILPPSATSGIDLTIIEPQDAEQKSGSDADKPRRSDWPFAEKG